MGVLEVSTKNDDETATINGSIDHSNVSIKHETSKQDEAAATNKSTALAMVENKSIDQDLDCLCMSAVATGMCHNSTIHGHCYHVCCDVNNPSVDIPGNQSANTSFEVAQSKMVEDWFETGQPSKEEVDDYWFEDEDSTLSVVPDNGSVSNDESVIAGANQSIDIM